MMKTTEMLSALAENESHIEKVHYILPKQNNVPDPILVEKMALFKSMRYWTKLVKL